MKLGELVCVIQQTEPYSVGFLCLGQVLHLCVWSHHRVAFHQPAVLWEPSPGHSHQSAKVLASLCSLPTDGPCLQHFSNLAREGQDEASDLFASEMAGPLFLLKGT